MKIWFWKHNVNIHCWASSLSSCNLLPLELKQNSIFWHLFCNTTYLSHLTSTLHPWHSPSSLTFYISFSTLLHQQTLPPLLNPLLSTCFHTIYLTCFHTIYLSNHTFTPYLSTLSYPFLSSFCCLLHHHSSALHHSLLYYQPAPIFLFYDLPSNSYISWSPHSLFISLPQPMSHSCYPLFLTFHLSHIYHPLPQPLFIIQYIHPSSPISRKSSHSS